MLVECGKTKVLCTATFTDQGQPLRLRVCFVVSGATGYTITCTATPEAYKKQARTFDEIIASLTFTP